MCPRTASRGEVRTECGLRSRSNATHPQPTTCTSAWRYAKPSFLPSPVKSIFSSSYATDALRRSSLKNATKLLFSVVADSSSSRPSLSEFVSGYLDLTFKNQFGFKEMHFSLHTQVLHGGQTSTFSFASSKRQQLCTTSYSLQS